MTDPIRLTYTYRDVYSITFDGVDYTPTELRAIIASAARERIVTAAYERQQDQQREWEAKYQAMTERAIAAEAVVRAAIDFLNDANASPIPLGDAVHMYEQKAKV